MIGWGTPLARDHPREYGENQYRRLNHRPPVGSSPRIRGKCDQVHMLRREGGIIPANTGKMSALMEAVMNAWDHPREYGENIFTPTVSASEPGSSPRIRGKCKHLHVSQGQDGIIPANTGKIMTLTPPSFTTGDHPREYGENNTSPTQNFSEWGSSPRIRGKSNI